MINRDKLENLLLKYNIKISRIIESEFPKEEWRNKNAQVSKLKNEIDNQDKKKYFDSIDLSKLVTEYLNQKEKTNFAPNYLINHKTKIPIIGDIINGWVRIIDQFQIKNFDCEHEFIDHDALIERNCYNMRSIKIFKRTNDIDREGEGYECFCKTDNKYYCGILMPESPDTYKLLDKNGALIFANKKIESSSQIVATYPYKYFNESIMRA